jgi:integrase
MSWYPDGTQENHLMKGKALSDRAVASVKPPPSGRLEIWDAVLPGFGLRVTDKGAKSWVAMYRTGNRKRRLTLGAYPKIKLGAARDLARDAFRAVGEGLDPGAAKQAGRRAPDTVDSVVDEFIHRHLEAQKRSPSYIKETCRIFEKHVLPRWRGRGIKSITRRDVLDLLDTIADAGAPVMANRTLSAVRKLFNWAISRDIVEASPVFRVGKPGAETKRERALSDGEIRQLWLALGALAYPFGLFLKFALVTAQRKGEIASLRWSDIDEALRSWELPAAGTKADRAHVVPLSPLAWAILDDVPRIGEFVFTTRGDRPLGGFSKAKQRLDRMLADSGAYQPPGPDSAVRETLAEPWTIHDLRRTAATGMGRLGVSRFIIGRVLNHADRSVTGIYDRHEYLNEKRQALEVWAQHLEAII